MTKSIAVCLLTALALLSGCQMQSVHTGHPGDMPVAMWIRADQRDDKGRPLHPQTMERVRDTLRESGLHPLLDETGLLVPEKEASQATEILMTDARLKGSGVIVFFPVPAGEGIRTAHGFEVPAAVRPAQDTNQ